LSCVSAVTADVFHGNILLVKEVNASNIVTAIDYPQLECLPFAVRGSLLGVCDPPPMTRLLDFRAV